MRIITAGPMVGLVIFFLAVQAAEPVIGVVVSQGRIDVDRAPVEGNANLTSGAAVKSGISPARIRLSNGNGATLGPGSQARVFADRVVLEKGQLVLTASTYRGEALGFRAVPAAGNAQAVVELRGGAVQVAALQGAVKVTDAGGIVVARVNPGRALSFAPPSAATAGTSTMTGVLRRTSGKFLLDDPVTSLAVELRGKDLERHLGSRIEVTGKVQASRDRESQVLLVSRLANAGRGQDPQQTGGNRPDQGGNRPDTEKPKTGMSNGAKVAIVLLIGGAAAGGVVAATGGSKDSVSR